MWKYKEGKINVPAIEALPIFFMESYIWEELPTYMISGRKN